MTQTGRRRNSVVKNTHSPVPSQQWLGANDQLLGMSVCLAMAICTVAKVAGL
jgi:hypothetical protein